MAQMKYSPSKIEVQINALIHPGNMAGVVWGGAQCLQRGELHP